MSWPASFNLVNAFWVAQLALENSVWLEWVPSAANPADLPSRGNWTAYFEAFPGTTWIDTVLPPMAGWLAPFEDLALDLGAFLRSHGATD